MNVRHITKSLILCILSVITFSGYAAQPLSHNRSNCHSGKPGASSKATKPVTLSFTLFNNLCLKSTDEVLDYLKSQGCKIEYSCEVFSTSVRGGTINIYPPQISYPRIGRGSVEFITTDPNVYKAWCRGLLKAGYESDKEGVWTHETAHWPVFGTVDYLDVDIDGADYGGSATLYLIAFPMKYDESKGCYDYID